MPRSDSSRAMAATGVSGGTVTTSGVIRSRAVRPFISLSSVSASARTCCRGATPRRFRRNLGGPAALASSAAGLWLMVSVRSTRPREDQPDDPGPHAESAVARRGGHRLPWPRRLAGAGNPVSIATGTTGGVYYPLGGALANFLSRRIPGMSATVEVTGGSAANFQLLGAGRVGLIFRPGGRGRGRGPGRGPFRGRPCPRAPSPCSTPTACRS